MGIWVLCPSKFWLKLFWWNLRIERNSSSGSKVMIIDQNLYICVIYNRVEELKWNEIPIKLGIISQKSFYFCSEGKWNEVITRFLSKVKVKVRVTLLLAVYRQSVRLGVKPLESHDQRLFFSTERLRSCFI
jgi:hypothetical protein